MYDDSANMYKTIFKKTTWYALRHKGCTLRLNRQVHTQACVLSTGSMEQSIPLPAVKVFANIFTDERLKIKDACTLLSMHAGDKN